MIRVLISVLVLLLSEFGVKSVRTYIDFAFCRYIFICLNRCLITVILFVIPIEINDLNVTIERLNLLLRGEAQSAELALQILQLRVELIFFAGKIYEDVFNITARSLTCLNVLRHKCLLVTIRLVFLIQGRVICRYVYSLGLWVYRVDQVDSHLVIFI